MVRLFLGATDRFFFCGLEKEGAEQRRKGKQHGKEQQEVDSAVRIQDKKSK